MSTNRDPRATAIHRTRLRQATEILHLVATAQSPADKTIEGYFRQHREMGSRDRAFAAETVYGCLRRYRWIEYVLRDLDRRGADLAAWQAAAYLLTQQGWSATVLRDAGMPEVVSRLSERIRTLDIARLPLAVRMDMPDWLAERLAAQYGEEEAVTLAQALNQAASLDVRVNTLKATRDDVAQRLAAEGYAVEPCRISPVCLRRDSRAPLFTTQAFRDGLFEVQDEGSQLLSLMLEPQPRERVVDFCAGAGGKTLHIGALMKNRGTVYAFDVSPKRLENLKPRLKRAGLDNVRAVAIKNENDTHVHRLRGTLDRVLVDAPCSGTGTLRRNPDIKLRDLNLADITATQTRILDAAAQLLKSGGRLVYATCSLLREENDDIIAAFLERHPRFRLVPAAEILSRQGVTFDISEPMLRLLPHRTGTDGFFAAAMVCTAVDTAAPRE